MYTKYYDRMKTTLRRINLMRDALGVPDTSHETTMKRVRDLIETEGRYHRLAGAPVEDDEAMQQERDSWV